MIALTALAVIALTALLLAVPETRPRIDMESRAVDVRPSKHAR
jgi:hypothetical protein